MYVYETDAVAKKVADGNVQITCSKKLLKERNVVNQCSMFGCKEVEFSKCPLIRGALPVIKNKKKVEEEE